MDQMTCRQAIAVRPALEADKQPLPWVQHDEQPLSAGEPLVLGLLLELARQKADLLLSGSGVGRWQMARLVEARRLGVIEESWFFELITKLFTGPANYQFG
jgi:hypothetical protein